MATTKGTAIAAPSIFGSDPVEQAFATGLVKSDAGESGALYALMSAARDRRGLATDQYRTDLRESNQLAALLERQGMQAEIDKEALKQLAPLANAGIQAYDVPAAGRMYTDPGGASAREPAALQRAETRAKIAKLNAESVAKYGEGGPKVTETVVYDSNGMGQREVKIQGGTAQQRYEIGVENSRIDAMRRGRPDPGKLTPDVRPGQTEGRNTSKDAVIQRHGGVAQ